MRKSKKFGMGVLAACAVSCFALGYAVAAAGDRTDWVGFLTYGVETEVDPMIRPRPSGLSSAVSGDIKIGLRDDGVVVWKQQDDSTD